MAPKATPINPIALGRLASVAFPISATIACIAVIIIWFQMGINLQSTDKLFNCCSCIAAVLGIVFGSVYCVRRKYFSVFLRACILGIVFSFGICIAFANINDPLCRLGVYIMFFTFFHWSEYVATAWTNPMKLSLDSFLLNHSVEYWIAAVSSWVEFGLEYYFLPEMKDYKPAFVMGFLLCIIGEGMRKAAMFTAGTSFTHLISYNKRLDHKLVTHGVYAFCRHPSYMGWFSWSIGTQILLCNPICTVAYSVVSWKFFRHRIQEEERLLIKFFGDEYIEYQKRVPSGLPGISGHLVA